MTVAFIASLGGLARRGARVRARVDREVRAPLGARPRHAGPARARLRLRAELHRPLDRARALRGGGPRWRSPSTGRSGRSARLPSCSRRGLRSSPPGRCSSIPGIAGHASQTSPAALALALDFVHLICGSVWIGGLLGLLVLWFSTPAASRRAVLALVVPRFSKVAFVSVLCLLATGVAASYLHLPTLASLWQTSYGKVILIKSGAARRHHADRRRQPARDASAPRRDGHPRGSRRARARAAAPARDGRARARRRHDRGSRRC